MSATFSELGSQIIQRQVAATSVVLESFRKFGAEREWIGERELRRVLNDHLQIEGAYMDILIENLKTQD